MRTRKDPVVIFKTRFTKTESGCWEYIGKIARNGYGVFTEYVGIKSQNDNICHLAHRFSYELFKGKIPKGLQIDHLCRNRKCVNPDHMEIVTAKENTARGFSPASLNARKTHCNKGHELIGENLVTRARGINTKRECRACNRMRTKKHNDKKQHNLNSLRITVAVILNYHTPPFLPMLYVELAPERAEPAAFR